MNPMRSKGEWRTNESQSWYAILLSNCIQSKNFRLGKSVHSRLIKTSFILDTFFANRLIDFYFKCNFIDCASKLFDEMPVKNVRTWNTLISGFCHSGHFREALQLLTKMPEPNIVGYNSIISSLSKSGFNKESFDVFLRMQRHGQDVVLMDEFTVVGLAAACASLGVLGLLRQVHGIAIAMDLDFNMVVCNALIDAYGKCGEVNISYLIFCQMEKKDVVSWNSMVVAYGRASRLKEACLIFNQMPIKNVVSWTAYITLLVRNGEGEQALSCLKKMEEEHVVPNDFTYVGVLSACADLSLISSGKQIHCCIIRLRGGIDINNVFVTNALIDMYCKCGDMKSSMRMFEKFCGKDIVTWNSIITGFAQNGYGHASISTFEKMVKANVRPNHATLMAVLSACSHSGLESEGIRVLEMMENDLGLIPQSNHYSILVDLLGRKNRLQEALEVIEKTPKGSDYIGMWGALLSTCRVHGNLELATKAANALFELEPNNTGRYVMLSNVYATAGKWSDADRIRSLIEDRDLRKEVGLSWIEVKNARHKFVAEDVFNSDFEEIQELLLNLVDQMKNDRYSCTKNQFSPEDT